MSFGDWMLWILSITLFAIYITCIFTVCSLTFQKGHKLLGWLGIFFPILWLIGAVLPPKPGSPFARKQAVTQQR